MPETDPSPWELMRAIQRVERTLSDMKGDMLTQKMFELHQKGTDRRFEVMEKDLQEEATARVGGDAELKGKLTDRVNFKRGIWAAVFIAVISSLLTFIFTLVNAGISA